MLLQSIVIDDRAYEVDKASASFIRSHIFPGGSLPSVEVIARCLARHTDLRIADLHELTPHYAETLRRWRTNVERIEASSTGWATTNASADCGGSTWPTARPGSTRDGSASCRCCWASPAGGRQSPSRPRASSATPQTAPPIPSSRRNQLAPSAISSADQMSSASRDASRAVAAVRPRVPRATAAARTVAISGRLGNWTIGKERGIDGIT